MIRECSLEEISDGRLGVMAVSNAAQAWGIPLS